MEHINAAGHYVGRNSSEARPAVRMLDALGKIDAQALSFHTSRYSSAKALRELVEDLGAGNLDAYTSSQVAAWVRDIADACAFDDGGEWGAIPCLGGEPASHWHEALSAAQDVG